MKTRPSSCQKPETDEKCICAPLASNPWYFYVEKDKRKEDNACSINTPACHEERSETEINMRLLLLTSYSS